MSTATILNPSVAFAPPTPQGATASTEPGFIRRTTTAVVRLPGKAYRNVKRAINKVFSTATAYITGAAYLMRVWLHKHPHLENFLFTLGATTVAVFTFVLAFVVGYIAAIGLLSLVGLVVI